MTAPKPIVERLVLFHDLVEIPCPLRAPDIYQRLDLIWHQRLSDNATSSWFKTVLSKIANEIDLSVETRG